MKYSFRRYTSFLLAVLTIASIGLGSVVSAQTATTRESITMSPTSRKYTIDAGKTINDKLTIVNGGTTDYDFLVYARPFSVENNDYQNPDFTKAKKNTDLYAWVQFPQTKFHAKAGETVTVNYIIQVPEGAAPGGHYGVIFAETQPDAAQASGNSVVRKKRVGSLMYATVNGTYRNTGESAGGEIPFWQPQPPLHTSVAVKNTGNTDFTNNTRITVRDVFGNIKYDAAKPYQILPETTRTISLDWEKSPWFGLYRVETQQQFLDQTVKNSGYVLMMPRYMPAALLIILIIGGLYAWSSRRKSKK